MGSIIYVQTSLKKIYNSCSKRKKFPKEGKENAVPALLLKLVPKIIYNSTVQLYKIPSATRSKYRKQRSGQMD